MEGIVIRSVREESPAEAGGLQTGDIITLDVATRRLHLHLSDEEIAARLSTWKPAPPHYTRGYGKLFLNHVTQSHLGCDFDFLQAE